jgi:hypothetical protein
MDAQTVVRISLPRDERSPRLIRVSAGAWAADLGLESADVDNLRIAVDELVSALVRIGNGQRIDVELRASDRELVVIGGTDGSAAPWETGEYDLVRQILAVVAHTYAVEEREGAIEFELCHPRPTGMRPEPGPES